MGLIADAICETLWPTRCALCDAPGAVLCTRCAARLDYLDFWRACPRCGAAFGFLQCDHCTPLVNKGEHTRPCISALRYTADTGILIKTYKDKGEQRLSETLAAILANALPPSWLRWANGVTYVSATKAARRRRGFDHMELLARSLAGQCGLPCIRALNPPTARDQRILDRAERKQNMQGRFTACEPLPGRRLNSDRRCVHHRRDDGPGEHRARTCRRAGALRHRRASVSASSKNSATPQTARGRPILQWLRILCSRTERHIGPTPL